MKERYGLIQFLGKDSPVIGEDIFPGQQAPEFHAVTQNWEYIPVLESTKGKVRIIAAVPFLETSVCDRETRRFNEEAAKLGKDIVIIVISTDLPFTQKRWCGAAGIDQVWVVSDHRDVEFGTRYSCLMKEPRILRRAVFVVDRNDKVTHVEYMTALGEEPNYERVLEAAKAAL